MDTKKNEINKGFMVVCDRVRRKEVEVDKVVKKVHKRKLLSKEFASRQPETCSRFDEDVTDHSESSRTWCETIASETGLKVALFAVLWAICGLLGFGAVYFIIAALVVVYRSMSTSSGKGEGKRGLSAYSVFNRDCKQLEGQFTSEQFEKSMQFRR